MVCQMTILLVERYSALLVDLDGVVYVGSDAVPHAIESLEEARARGCAIAYVTNNAARPPNEVAAHLRVLGLTVDDEHVVTSSQAGAVALLEQARLAPGSRVLSVGGPGVAQALAEVGLVPVSVDSPDVVAVMQGYGPTVGWPILAEAAYALARGVPWMATNVDATLPTARGLAPGNGSLVATLTKATGRTPSVAGKPQPALAALAMRRLGVSSALVVGDRLDTDIAFAHAAGLDSLLVFTGVNRLADIAATPWAPTYVANDLRSLHEPPVPYTAR